MTADVADALVDLDVGTEKPRRHLGRPLSLLVVGRDSAILPTWWVAAYAPLWALGVGFLWWPLTLLRLVTSGRLRRPRVLTVLCVTPAFLIVSLASAYFRDAGQARLLAAAFLLVPWLCMTLSTALRWTSDDARALARGIVCIASIQGFITLVALLAYPAGSGWRLALGLLLPDRVTYEPPLKAWLVADIVFQDYYAGFVLRSSGIFGNPTWAGAVAALSLLILLTRWRYFRFGKWYMQAVPAAAVSLANLSLIRAYSRICVIGLVSALGLAACIGLLARLSKRSQAVVGAAGLTAAVAALLTVDLSGVFNRVNAARAGSLDSRQAIYEQTLEKVHTHHVLMGSGIKEQGVDLVASLGSHSTFLGLLYRGGWPAFWGFAAFLTVLGMTALRRRDGLALGLVVFTAFYSFSEDLDAGHFAPLAVLLAVSILSVREAPSARCPSKRVARALLEAHGQRRRMAVTWLNHSSALSLLRSRPGLLDRFDVIGVDGFGLRRLLGGTVPRTSADLVMPLVLPELRGARVALVGGDVEGLESRRQAIARSLEHGSRVVSAVDGFAGLPGLLDVDAWIAEVAPDFVLVGLGAPHQEIYVKFLSDRLPHAVVVTCGGFMDQYAQVGYYPRWAYPLRLNWLVRLAREPARLWRRYTFEVAEAVVKRRALKRLVVGRRGYAFYGALLGGDGAGEEPQVLAGACGT